MPPPLLFSLDGLDLGRVIISRDQLYERLPHRHEFMLLGGVCHIDLAAARAVAFADISLHDWWARGHVPGRPLLPGVLMLEMAGQASAVVAERCWGCTGFIGFGGVDQCKFRDAISAATRLHILIQGIEHRPRRIVCNSQVVANGRLVFEAQITGMTMG